MRREAVGRAGKARERGGEDAAVKAAKAGQGPLAAAHTKSGRLQTL